MPYKLIRLAPGSYDVFLDGVVVASLVQARDDRPVWVAELLLDLPMSERPAPFKRLEHTFSSFEEAMAWLGDPEIVDHPPDRRYTTADLVRYAALLGTVAVVFLIVSVLGRLRAALRARRTASPRSRAFRSEGFSYL